MKGIQFELENTDEDDYRAVQQGFVSITPLKIDMTNYEQFQTVRSIFNE